MTAAPAPTPLPAAILWDLDGTLVDTEPIWIRAETELMAQFGQSWTHADGLTLVGNDLEVSAAILRERGADLPVPQIVRWLIDRVNGEVRRCGPAFRPGAAELVAQAHRAGVPQAIVTMSYREQAETVAESLPTGAIGAIVAGDDVSRGKPDPECYLRAARLLGAPPSECIAVEDSVTGVSAAMASGARTVTVPFMVAVPERPGLARLPSLAGVDLLGLTVAAGLGTGAPDGAARPGTGAPDGAARPTDPVRGGGGAA